VNWTGISHAVGTVLLVAGIFAPGRSLTVGLFVVAALCFIAGIVVARRGDGSTARTDASG